MGGAGVGSPNGLENRSIRKRIIVRCYHYPPEFVVIISNIKELEKMVNALQAANKEN